MKRAILLLALFGCNILTGGSSTTRRLAYVVYYGKALAITAPSSITVSTPFTVEFYSFGGGCIQQGETQSAVAGLQADLRAYQYQYHPGPNEACTLEERADRNTAIIHFDSAGTALIRVSGLNHPGDTLVVLEKSITVIP